MLDGGLMYLGNGALYLLVAIGVVGALLFPLVMLLLMKHKGQVELDHYGKYRGSGPAKSFVCPACLKRSYAPSHIAKRWCSSCNKSFPERPEIAKPQAKPSK